MSIPPLSSTHKPTTPSSTSNTHITSPAATAHGNAPTTNTHHMVTRAKAGISKPLARMNCHATTTSPIPHSHLHVLRDLNWHKAMVDEYNALISNGTWALVPRLTNVKTVRSMWLLKHKFNADGSLSRYKARLVANGRSQQQGIDCDKTFSPVVKPAAIRTVLSLAVTRDWPIHQLNVKNAFLHGQLSKTVYMHQLPRFVDSAHPDYVCHLQRSLYGLKQDPRAWFQWFASFITHEILERAHMQHCNPCKTTVDTESKLSSDGDPVISITLYRSLAGALQYLTFTRPDISYAVQQISITCYDLRDSTFYCLIVILAITWTTDHGNSASCLVSIVKSHAYTVLIGLVALLLICVELHAPLSTATLVYYDNVSAVYLSTNPVQHQRTKHIEIDIHFVREYVASGQVRVLHVPSRFQYADIFTKSLPAALFLEFRSSLNVRRPPAPTAGEY
ncbi:ribonuclease H-like domain-containing protein [Tanacetum coccineum]|uniref:Ribonuclease H-like domain-containing protein n=1 Tax=Tanacetum coccineum TaxID=301880 RepID=A0ABQ5IDZ1_9ASTR